MAIAGARGDVRLHPRSAAQRCKPHDYSAIALANASNPDAVTRFRMW